MANGIEHTTDPQQVANELYWSSDESVNRIADRLGLSKGSLYAAIKPKPSDSLCPICQSQLGYANRTALERGTLSCSKCTHEFNARSGPPAAEPLADPPLGAPKPVQPSRDSQPPSTRPAAVGSRQWVVGTTLLALGAGLLVSRFVRRR